MRLGSYACELAPGLARAAGSTASEHHPRAAPPPLRVQLPVRAARSSTTACAISGRRPTASSSRSSSCPAIPWYLAVQFHPEFKSKPLRPHPLFAGFVEAALPRTDGAAGRRDERHGDWRSTARVIARRAVSYNAHVTDPSSRPSGPCASPTTSSSAADRLVAHRRALRHRKRGARDRAGRRDRATSRSAPACRSSSRRRSTRRTAPPDGRSAGPGLDEGLRVLARVQGATSACPILTDIHEPGAGRRARPRSPTCCRFPRSSRGRPTCSSPRRRPGASSTSRRDSSWRPLDMRHAIAKVTDAGNPRVFVTERGFTLRLQQPRRRHARVPDDARARRAGRLRRDAQPAAARRRRRRHGRAGGVHRAAGVGRRRRRRRRRVPRSARGAGAREERRAERAARSTCSSRCSTGSCASTRSSRARSSSATPMTRDLTATSRWPARCSRPKPRPSSASSTASTRASTRAVELLLDCRGRVIVTGMGKSGHHLPQDRGDARRAPARRRSSCIPAEAIHGDLGVIRRRRRRRAVAQRRDRGAPAPARDDPPASARS